ncbi:MAG: FAD-dependent oxidoreductase [Ruminococcaceae bacterium]|nr:FAD-dependent oxidoreductase [Oscillospiraceae bacterium]
MKTLTENIQTKICHECDVLVVGGGFAGIAAALSAARRGAKTILVEKSYYLGGLGTSGLVTIYLPICDGMGRQVSYGIAEELLKLSVSIENDWKRGAVTWLKEGQPRGEEYPRYDVNFNPALFAFSAEKLLLDEGVQILYGVSLVNAAVENEKIKYAIVEGKSGRYAIEAKSYVDASGDADLAERAGAPTSIFKYKNVLAAWYYSYGKDGFKLNQFGAADLMPGMKPVQKLSDKRFVGLEDVEISDFMQESHEKLLAKVLERRVEDPTHIPTTIASIPQFRMTRRIVGEYTFTLDDDRKYFEDSVGLYPNWRKRGPVYELPMRSLYSAKIKNLAAAGRNISVDDDMWEISRVIPCCSVMGEAAGLMAAMSDDFTTLDVKDVQKELYARGVKLHENEL